MEYKEYDEIYTKKPKSMSSLFDKFQVGRQKTKHEYEYQEICQDLEKDFGKLIWTVPTKTNINYSNHNLLEAGKRARKQGITTVPYLIGIMKKL